jgi:hypothetical protein
VDSNDFSHHSLALKDGAKEFPSSTSLLSGLPGPDFLFKPFSTGSFEKATAAPLQQRAKEKGLTCKFYWGPYELVYWGKSQPTVIISERHGLNSHRGICNIQISLFGFQIEELEKVRYEKESCVCINLSLKPLELSSSWTNLKKTVVMIVLSDHGFLSDTVKEERTEHAISFNVETLYCHSFFGNSSV